MNKQKTPSPVALGFLIATVVLGLAALALTLAGMPDVMAHPAVIIGAVVFAAAVLATAARARWWQKQHRTADETQPQLPDAVQRRVLPQTLGILGMTVVCIVAIVLGVTGQTARNGTVVMVLGVVGLAPTGLLLFLFTYGYLASKPDQSS